MYTAPKGKTLCGFDLSAAEAWIVAYLAHDTNMKRELGEGDIHSFCVGRLETVCGRGKRARPRREGGRGRCRDGAEGLAFAVLRQGALLT